MESKPNSLHQFLKTETKRLHQDAEKSLKAEELFSPALKQAELIDHLKIQAASHQRLQEALNTFKGSSFLHSFWPLEDFAALAYHDLNNFEVSSIPLPPEVNFENPYQAVGALYVINGSSLGRRHIGKALKAKVKQWQIKPLQFYPPKANQGINWPLFCENLNKLELTKEERAQVLVGAKKTFGVFIN